MSAGMPSSTYQFIRSLAPVLVPLRRSRPAGRRTPSPSARTRGCGRSSSAGVISLRKLLPTWAMPNGGFLRVVCSTWAKLVNMPLRRLGAQVRVGPGSLDRPGLGLEHQVERVGLGEAVLRAAVRARVRVVELVEPEPLLAVRAVDERVGEVGEVAGRLPHLRRAQDRRVDQHDVVALLDHRRGPTPP